MSHDLEGVQTLVSQTLILPSDREREGTLYLHVAVSGCMCEVSDSVLRIARLTTCVRLVTDSVLHIARHIQLHHLCVTLNSE